MLLLGIDTSGKTASAALYDTETEIFTARKTLYTLKTHSQVIMPMCRDIIEQTGKKITDIEAIAAAIGPGSYTGLRIGAAAVKAMCFALKIKCCGVSTLEGLAYNNLAYNGIICAVMKARGELVYAGIYKSCGICIEKIFDDSLIDKQQLCGILTEYGEKILLCGDAAKDFCAEFPTKNFFAASAGSVIQDAAGICLAASHHEFVDPEQLEVAYLQKVKAEKDLEQKLQKGS